MNDVPLASGIRNICVYCGSGSGRNPAFAKAARDFGRILAENRIGLVYGGGSPRLMGGIGPPTLRPGGFVTRPIPRFFCERGRTPPPTPPMILVAEHPQPQHML